MTITPFLSSQLTFSSLKRTLAILLYIMVQIAGVLDNYAIFIRSIDFEFINADIFGNSSIIEIIRGRFPALDLHCADTTLQKMKPWIFTPLIKLEAKLTSFTEANNEHRTAYQHPL